MPEVIITLVSTMAMLVLYYLTVDKLDKKVHLGLARNGNRFSSKVVYIIGVVMACGWIAVNLVQLSMWLPRRILNMCLLLALAVLSVSDWKKHRIPNCVLVPILIVWVVVTGICIFIDISSGVTLFISSLVGGFLGGLLFMLCYLLASGRLGAGDVKLVFILGLYLTEQKILSAILVGMIVCCVHVMLDKNGTPKGGVPLAPFLFLGTLIAMITKISV